MDRSMKILVAGGAGFLGSYLCDRLLSQGADVTCLDNLLTGRSANIEHMLSNSRFHFINGDIRHELPNEKFDQIWNLASPASPPHYQADPIGTLMINVEGTYKLLELARISNARFFQASTSEVYGDPDIHPQPESYKGSVNSTGPRACYDEGKRAAEALCADYRRVHGLDVRIARIFNTYGPGMDPKDGRVVSNFIVNALMGNPLELYGGGNQTRSFCYRDDLIEGFLRLMQHPNFQGPVNLGNPREFTVRELAQLVKKLTGSSVSFRERPMPADDPKQRRPDISLAKKELGWEPGVSLEEGLALTIAYFSSSSQRHSSNPLDIGQ
jgi:UDP-glucuronate decarboxylase